jgi:hypothetical protein
MTLECRIDEPGSRRQGYVQKLAQAGMHVFAVFANVSGLNPGKGDMMGTQLPGRWHAEPIIVSNVADLVGRLSGLEKTYVRVPQCSALLSPRPLPLFV